MANESTAQRTTITDYSEDGRYKHVFWCENCGAPNERFVLKGTPLRGLRITCEHCGCETTKHGWNIGRKD